MTAKVHQIAPTLTRLAVAIDTIEPHPQNYRRGDVDQIAASFKRFGQLKPIVVQDSTGLVVAGNHSLAAARQLGWTHIAVARVPLEDDEARAFLVADNRTSDLAENDDQALGALLNELALDGKLDGTGWVADDVDDLLASLEAVDRQTPPPADDATPSGRGAGAGPMPHREVVLMMTVEQRDAFTKHIGRLSQVFETEGTAQTVLAVVADAARRADAPVT